LIKINTCSPADLKSYLVNRTFRGVHTRFHSIILLVLKKTLNR